MNLIVVNESKRRRGSVPPGQVVTATVGAAGGQLEGSCCLACVPDTLWPMSPGPRPIGPSVAMRERLWGR